MLSFLLPLIGFTLTFAAHLQAIDDSMDKFLGEIFPKTKIMDAVADEDWAKFEFLVGILNSSTVAGFKRQFIAASNQSDNEQQLKMIAKQLKDIWIAAIKVDYAEFPGILPGYTKQKKEFEESAKKQKDARG